MPGSATLGVRMRMLSSGDGHDSRGHLWRTGKPRGQTLSLLGGRRGCWMTLFCIHFSPQHATILQPGKTIESSRKSGLAWKVGLLQVLLDTFALEEYPAWVLPLAKFPLSRLVLEIRLRSGTLSAGTHGTRATLCSWLTLEEMEIVTLVGAACISWPGGPHTIPQCFCEAGGPRQMLWSAASPVPGAVLTATLVVGKE